MSEEGGAEKRRKRHGKPPGLPQWDPIPHPEVILVSNIQAIQACGGFHDTKQSGSCWSCTELQPEPCSSGLTYPWEAPPPTLHTRQYQGRLVGLSQDFCLTWKTEDIG